MTEYNPFPTLEERRAASPRHDELRQLTRSVKNLEEAIAAFEKIGEFTDVEALIMWSSLSPDGELETIKQGCARLGEKNYHDVIKYFHSKVVDGILRLWKACKDKPWYGTVTSNNS